MTSQVLKISQLTTNYDSGDKITVLDADRKETLQERTSNFEDIEIDFSQSTNRSNGGKSSLRLEKGDDTGDGTGKKLGALIGLAVDSSGKIYGSYDNGQIAVAQFANASGLEKVGNNCYQTTLNSGEFNGIGVEVDADGSSINSGQLEMSNVDLSAQFTDMIITQRGFQANSRVITVSDTLLEELINLKR
jgi:flagellar hook protein FlgE